MKSLQKKFVSFHVFEKQLQIFCVAINAFVNHGLIFVGVSLFLYLLFFTCFWWLPLLYTGWMYLDRHTPKTGGRSVKWLRSCRVWWYVKQYFPAKVVCIPNFTVNPSKNYLFCCFPHGVLPFGWFINMVTYPNDLYEMYPNFNLVAASLDPLFFLPLWRETTLGLGAISCSAKSISYVLSQPKGGNIVSLLVGGSEETFTTMPGQYKFVLKKRRGFVRIALQNGSPLVPVITFGENELFEQLRGTTIRRIQNFLKKYLRFAPVFYYGRGLFQKYFGFLPRQIPVTTVRPPIEVVQIVDPTREDVDELHRIFLQAITKLFEENKHKYLQNPDEQHLEFV